MMNNKLDPFRSSNYNQPYSINNSAIKQSFASSNIQT